MISGTVAVSSTLSQSAPLSGALLYELVLLPPVPPALHLHLLQPLAGRQEQLPYVAGGQAWPSSHSSHTKGAEADSPVKLT